MAYENVNVASLKSSINSCINSLDYTGIKEIKSQLGSGDSWNAAAKDNFKAAIDKLIERNKKIKEQLKNYLQVADLIEQYQKLDKENVNCLNNLTSMGTELSTAKQAEKGFTTPEEKNSQAATNNKQKINNLNSKINQTKSKMEANVTKMKSLKSKIDSMI